MKINPALPVRRWPAELDFGLSVQSSRTVLSRLRFHGPLRIQRLFYPESRATGESALPAHCYLLHPPGGLVSGDHLQIRGRAASQAHGLITTPAAGKVYRAGSMGAPQYQSIVMEVDDQGILEWFPQETIVFNGAEAHLSAVFSLARGGRLMGWDILCLGRPAAGEEFIEGRVSQLLKISRRGRPLFHERLHLEGFSELRRSWPGWQGRPVSATFFACGREGDAGDEQALRQAGAALKHSAARSGREPEAGLTGVTCRAGILLARYLGGQTGAARDFCLTAWKLLRPLLLGRAACIPRIWNT
jgi:urease accessory protein